MSGTEEHQHTQMSEVAPSENRKDPCQYKDERNHKPIEANLTLSTKLSSDQLICKSPPTSTSASVKSVLKQDFGDKICCQNGGIFYLGFFQVLFGFLMVVFGILVLVHHSSLSQIGGGIWGGLLALSTGIIGITAGSKKWCPLKIKAQKVAHTAFLAFSLLSLAVSQLVLVVCATGIARDIYKTEEPDKDTNEEDLRNKNTIPIAIPENYLSLLSNVGLLIVSGIECLCSAISAYKSARDLCPCFQKAEDTYGDLSYNNSHAIVSSWLGKHTPPPPLYVVTTTSSLGKSSKLSGGLPVAPVFTFPPPPMMQPPLMGYPLIPAPLGPIPSPIIPPPSRKEIMAYKKLYKHRQMVPEPTPKRSRSRSRSKSKERPLTEEEVAKTYTGLDRTIAEEFIDICDSRNTSLCSSSSCTSGCQSPNIPYTSSDATSRQYLVDKV